MDYDKKDPLELASAKLASLVDFMCERGERQAERLGFTFIEDDLSVTEMTYGALSRRARAIAARLQAEGAQRTRALLLFAPGIEFIQSFYGCMAAGATAVPAYPPDPSRLGRTLPRLRAIASDSKPTVVLTTSPIKQLAAMMFADAPELAELTWIAVDEIADGEANDWSNPGATGRSLAFLQYTSGSTAAPKGVMVTHDNILHNARQIGDVMVHDASSKVLCWLPMFHDMGLVGFVLHPMFMGCRSYIMSPLTFLQRPLRWLSALTEHRIDSTGGPNFGYDLCVRKVTDEMKAGLDLSTLKVTFTGAEPIMPETLRRFSEAFAGCGFRSESFYPCYGLAEGTLLATGAEALAGAVYLDADVEALQQNRVKPGLEGSEQRRLVGSGKVPRGTKVVIIDPERGTRARPETVGEICVFSPSTAKGYWDRTAESEDTFEFYLADTGEGPFLRTGDLGFLRDGELFITGRVKDLIIVHGANHYPQDLENTTRDADPAVRPGCVAAFAIETGKGEQLAVVAEFDPKKSDEPEAVIDRIKGKIAADHQLPPAAVVLIAPRTIFKTSSGKIQRRATKKAFLEDALETVAQWRRDDLGALETTIAGPPPKRAEAPRTVRAEAPREARAEAPANARATPSPEDRTPPPPRAKCARTTAEISSFIAKRVAEALERGEGDLDLDKKLGELGLNSVDEVALSGDLEDWLGETLPPTLTWHYPTIRSLSLYLAGEAVEPVTSGDTGGRR